MESLNQKLIDAFVESIAGKYTEKTVKKHQRNLTFFLNEYLAYHLETLFGEEILDLESPISKGFTTNEMRETKTALKKFYRFLTDQQLISKGLNSRVTESLKPQLGSARMSASLRREIEYLQDQLDDSQPVFDEETDALIKDYFTAFANLYGMISCDQAYRIICRQNPGLKLPANKFIELIERLSFKTDETGFVIDQFAQPRIVHSELMNDPEKLDWLDEQTLGMTFAIPKKTSLLKYAEEGYVEPSSFRTALRNFYQNTLGVPQAKLEKYLKATVKIIRTWTKDKISEVFNEINEMLLSDGYGCSDRDALERFIQLIIAFYNNMPRWALRGFTPAQGLMQPNAFELLDGQKTLNKRLIKLLKSAQVDPLELIFFLLANEDLDQKTADRLQQQIVDLDIPSLD